MFDNTQRIMEAAAFSLNVSSARPLSSYTKDELAEISYLNLHDVEGTLSALEMFPNLSQLDLYNSCNIELALLTSGKLDSLTLSATSIMPNELVKLVSVSELTVINPPAGIASMAEITQMSALRRLAVTGAREIDLSRLDALPALHTLFLRSCGRIAGIEGLLHRRVSFFDADRDVIKQLLEWCGADTLHQDIAQFLSGKYSADEPTALAFEAGRLICMAARNIILNEMQLGEDPEIPF